MTPLVIRRIGYDERTFAPLMAEAQEDGSFLMRLVEEWRSGTLRFDRHGELLLGAFDGASLVGLGGISLDPYQPAPGLGRVRHVYVLPQRRGEGIARALMEALISHAGGRFGALVLRTRNPAAATLYESLGFVAHDAPFATHRLSLG